MHVVNLGLGYRCNGSSMLRGSSIRAVLSYFFVAKKVIKRNNQPIIFLDMTVDSCMFVPFIIIIKQGVPTSSQVWGEHADLANALDEAYLHFPKLVQNIPNSNNPTTFQDLDGALVCQPIYTDQSEMKGFVLNHSLHFFCLLSCLNI